MDANTIFQQLLYVLADRSSPQPITVSKTDITDIPEDKCVLVREDDNGNFTLSVQHRDDVI